MTLRHPIWLLLCTLVFAVLACPGHAATDGRTMTFRHLGPDDGLSQNAVLDILQDHQGYVWLATENGVNRYNGYELVRYYRAATANALADDFIYRMAEDANGDIWFATARSGIARWSRSSDTFTAFRHDPDDDNSLASDQTRTLLADRTGRLWVGTIGSGLSVFNPATGDFLNFRADAEVDGSLPNDFIYALLEDRAGNIWVGTDAGLARYDNNRKRFYQYTLTYNEEQDSRNRIRSLAEDQSGTLWVGTFGGGLRKLEPSSGRSKFYNHDSAKPDSLCHDHIRSVLEDKDKRLWVGTENGLCLLDRSSDTFQSFHAEVGEGKLSDNDILSLHQDSTGVLWVGTRYAGVNLWNPRSWLLGHHYDTEFLNTSISSFATSATDYWVGTIGRGLMRFNRKTGKRQTYKTDHGLADERVMALDLDAFGGLWIGTMFGGLIYFDPLQGAFENFPVDVDDPTKLPSKGIMSLYRDHADQLWVGTYGGGAVRYDVSSGNFIRLPQLVGNQVMSITQDLAGAMWFGTEKGLSRWRPDSGEVLNFPYEANSPRSPTAEAIYALHVDQQGRLWIGTAGGGLDLVLEDPAQPNGFSFSNRPVLRQYGGSVIYGIQSDTEGMLWLSTNHGLLQYDPATSSVKPYTKAHGLQSNEFNFGAHHKGTDGYLYFGGVNGFNRFRPEDLDRPREQPRITLTAVERGNRAAPTQVPHATLRAIDLTYEDDVLTFEFATMDFTDAKQNRYQYFLDGFDGGWIDAGTNRRITYTNLEPGEYTFRARGLSSEGLATRNEVKVSVDVAPPPWRSAPAFFGYVLALIALGWYVMRAFRIRRQREIQYREKLESEVAAQTQQLRLQNEELHNATQAKSQFLARMSHEIRTPMNGVMGMAELLLRSNLSSQQQRLAQTILSSANSLVAVINDILDLSKVEANRVELEHTEFDVIEVANECLGSMATQALDKNIELIADSPWAALKIMGDPLRVRQILTNLVGNALKFTEKGEVMLSVRIVKKANAQAKDVLELSVSDTGIGIKPEYRERIFELFVQEDETTSRRFGGTGLGLAISRQLAELMQGELSVTSTPGRGSTFTLSLPVDASVGVDTKAPAIDGKVVLIVANAALRSVLQRRLQDTGASEVVAYEHLRQLGVSRLEADHVFIEGNDLNESLRALQDVNWTPEPGQLVQIVGLNAAGNGAQLIKPVTTQALWRLLDPPTEETPSASQTQVSAPDNQVKPKLLVVEDNPVNQEVILGMLGTMGLNADIAGDGVEALERLQGKRYDLAFMDCGLPKLDGFEVTRQIRTDGNDVVIVALTANNIEGERQRCLDAGMNDFLTKPCSVADLQGAVQRWCGYVAAAPVTPQAVQRKPPARASAAERDHGHHRCQRPGADQTARRSGCVNAAQSDRHLSPRQQRTGRSHDPCRGRGLRSRFSDPAPFRAPPEILQRQSWRHQTGCLLPGVGRTEPTGRRHQCHHTGTSNH